MKTIINPAERQRLQGMLHGLGINPFQEAGISNVDFAYLRNNHIVLHQIMHLDLSVARTNVKYTVEGSSLQVINLTAGGQLSISFNKQNEPIPFSGAEQWESAFYEIYVTNTAQVATSCDLVIMVNGRFTPYYQVKAISPVVSATPTVKSVLINNAATLICASNILRRSVFIQSEDVNTENIYLGFDNALTVALGANAGYRLSIGGESHFLSPYYTGTIYGICASGGQYVRIWENFE